MSGPDGPDEVPFFRYPHVYRQHEEAVREALLDAAERGAYVLQEEVARFEERLADRCGVRHAVGVANATDGLELMLRAAGVGEGDEVILPSHTFVASAEAVVWNGATPVLAEIDPADHLMDPADAARRITPRTRALMPTQLNGRTAAMEPFLELCERHDLLLLEDSAQALGSTWRGRMGGTFGRAGVYSFYPAKTLGALGDAGAVVTDDDGLARELRRLRDHGRDPETGEVVRWGRNSRLDNLQAAVLLVKLRHLDEEIEERRRLAARYHENLRHRDELALPPPPTDDGPHFDVYQNYEVRAERRNELREHLAGAGVGTILQWGGRGVHQHEGLELEASLPRTERMFERELLLPMNSSLTADEVDRVCERIEAFYDGG